MMKNKIYTLVLSGVMAAGVAVAQKGEEAKFKKWAEIGRAHV